MTLIDRANQAIQDHKNQVLVPQKQLIELIRELIQEVSQAYEDGVNLVTQEKDFSPDELDHERRSA